MSILNKQTKQETIIYTIVWIVLFLSPVIELIINFESDAGASNFWAKRNLVDVWLSLGLFLIVFLIHNHVLAPMLVNHKKIYHYIIGCVVVISLFQLTHCMHKPSDVPHGPEPKNRTMPSPPNGRPPIDKHDITMFTIVFMMIGANLGVKAYFQSEEEKKRLAAVREQNLKQELNYLRYQINPHFIMNTLNNIHALVDIDPDQAKDSIVDMSRMMRYLLYESDKHYVTLNNAVNFLKKYINLMKLRYTDKVIINQKLPDNCQEDVVLVPLVFIPFVENAFKHGVSYTNGSTIDVEIEQRGGRLFFHCRNTKSHAQHEHGGVGLNNVTKRLDLIYHNDYSLDINDGEDTYDVLLNLPVKRAEDFEKITIKDDDNTST